MKINFKFEKFPQVWQVKYGNNKEQLKTNIIENKKVYITAFKNTTKTVYSSIFYDEDYFNINLIPKGCEKLKFLTQTTRNIRGFIKKVDYFKLLKKQGKKEYKYFITQAINEFIPDLENKIDELEVIIYTNIEIFLDED